MYANMNVMKRNNYDIINERVIRLNSELKLYIKKMQNRATISLVAIILTFISSVYCIIFLNDSIFVAVGFLIITIVSIIYLIFSKCNVNKELRESKYEPVIFKADTDFSFEEVIDTFEKLTDKENKVLLSEDVLFFRLNKMFELRAILYRTTDFNKKDFNNAKGRINKKANKNFNISSWVNQFDARKMMRFNIIYTDTLNDDLYKLISQNANQNLTRVEGIINIAIIGNRIIIPPIYGDCYLIEISRYKKVVRFINQVLLRK